MAGAPDPLPPADFGRPADVRDMAQAIAAVAENLDQTYPLLIAGERVAAAPRIVSVNPSAPSGTVSRFPCADAAHAARALDAVGRAWRPGPAPDSLRDALARAADLLGQRRFEFAAWICFEAGLTWTEADAEVRDAVAALRSAAAPKVSSASPHHPSRPPGVLGPPSARPADAAADPFHEPLGAGLALTPPASPLAAPAALAAGALAAGNAVCLCPARTAPTAAWKLVELLWDAGVPETRVALLTSDHGAGAPALPSLPGWRFLLFAGSAKAAADLVPPQAPRAQVLWAGVRGDAAVASDADPAAAAATIAVGAFARAGQGSGPSSYACAFVAAARFDAVVEAVAARAASLRVGAAIDVDTEVGPLCDAATLARARADRDALAGVSRPVVPAGAPAAAAIGDPPGEGWFLAPEVRVHQGDEPPATGTRTPVGPTLLIARVPVVDDAFAERMRRRSGRPLTLFGT